MGNSLSVVLDNYIGSAPFPCHLQLGTSAAINFSTHVSNKYNGGAFWQRWTVLYTIDASTCDLRLVRYVDRDGTINGVTVVLSEKITSTCRWIILRKRRTETDIGLSVNYRSIEWMKTKRTIHAWGGVTDTKFYLHGSGNRGTLLVEVCQKNSIYDEEANAVTVAHYFANSSGTTFNRSTESDIGLSVIAKFRPSNGDLDIKLEGPEQHPVSALFYMFDEVNRIGIWKPSMCPHCANIRRERDKMFCQSDDEDSDSVCTTHCGSRQNASIANDGRFRGHANGCSIRCKYFYANNY